MEKRRPSSRGIYFRPVAIACAAFLLAGCHRHDRQAAQESCRLIEADLRHDQLAKVLNLAGKGAQAWRDLPSSEAYSTYRLLESEALIEESKAGDALSILSALKPAVPKLQVRRDIDLARAMLALERYPESRAALERSLTRARAESLDSLSLRASIIQGTLLRRTGKIAEADQVWRGALVKAEELNDPYSRAMALNNLGFIRLKRSRFDQALPYFEEAHGLFEKAGSPRLSSIALNNLAICYYQLGDIDRASQMRLQVVAVQERIGAGPNLMNSYGETGRFYDGLGEHRKAISYYSRALRMAEQLGARSAEANWAVNLSQVYIQLQDWADAEKFNEQARRLSGADKEDLPLYVKMNAAAISAGRGQPAEAERGYRDLIASPEASAGLKWNADDELAKLRAAAHDSSQSNRYFEDAIGLIVESRKELSTKSEKITYLSQPIRIYQDYVQTLAEQGDWTKALLVADSSRAQVLFERLNQDKAGTAPGIREFQAAARAANSVLLSYWLTPKGSFAWVITGADARMVSLPENDARVRELVAAYREEIERGVRDPLTNTASAGWKLYQALIQPVQPWIPIESNVIVVPDGPLYDINLEALPVLGERPHYWIEQARLSIAPSLGVLLSKEPRRDRRHGEMLIVGDSEPVAKYPKLGYAAQEIASIENRLPSRVKTALIGPKATAGGYWNAHPERFALIHFTAHAEANRETPLDSAVILSPDRDDYKLYARDIFDSAAPLQADLVTVSACRSAGAKTYSGEGLIGFAWAFLHAGARHVIAGLWDVDDASTARLMDRLYAGLETGESPAQALREAKLEFVHTGGNLRKPFYWAPFQVYRRSAR